MAHVSDTCTRHWVGQFDPWDVRHAQGACDEIALWPVVLGHQSDSGNPESGYFYAVTHGAGGAAASVSVGGDDCLTLGLDAGQNLWAGGNGRIALIVILEGDVRLMGL